MSKKSSLNTDKANNYVCHCYSIKWTLIFPSKINSASACRKFHQLQQKEGETVLQFVTGLRKEGKDCSFGADFDNQIRDLVLCKHKSDFVKNKLFEGNN